MSQANKRTKYKKFRHGIHKIQRSSYKYDTTTITITTQFLQFLFLKNNFFSGAIPSQAVSSTVNCCELLVNNFLLTEPKQQCEGTECFCLHKCMEENVV